MASVALERLEQALQARRFDRTLLRYRLPSDLDGRRLAPTGWSALDAALGGGWRRGDMSEVVGSRSTGRTGILLATLAAATQRGEVVALVDAVDRFDPVSAAACGVQLDRLLWVRGAAITVEHAQPALIDRIVQWGVRALDLIVRAGGFGVAALDLADVPAARVRALPLATWMRIAHVNEGRETVCLLAGDAPMGRSAGGVSIRLAAAPCWTGHSPQSVRLTGLRVRWNIASATKTADKSSETPVTLRTLRTLRTLQTLRTLRTLQTAGLSK